MVRGGEKGRQEDDVICTLEVPVSISDQISNVLNKGNREQRAAESEGDNLQSSCHGVSEIQDQSLRSQR